MTDQTVLRVRFDQAGNVAAVQKTGKELIARVDPSGDKTPTLGRKRSFFEELFGNIGTISQPACPEQPAVARGAVQRRLTAGRLARLSPLTLRPKPSPMTATPAGMTYADYLKLDSLLSAQHPISDLHDEMLFVIIHQTKELVAEADAARGRASLAGWSPRTSSPKPIRRLSRISRIWTVMTLSWDVLATLTPVDYSAFRDVLGTSSGFQSAQFRELEFRLGIKDPRFLDFYEGGSEGHVRLEQGAGRAEAVGRGQCRAGPRRFRR